LLEIYFSVFHSGSSLIATLTGVLSIQDAGVCARRAEGLTLGLPAFPSIGSEKSNGPLGPRAPFQGAP
jgi:hypothetical protein